MMVDSRIVAGRTYREPWPERWRRRWGGAGWWALVCWCLGAGPGRAAELEAGACRIDITPPVGLPMWGYGARHAKPAEKVLAPLHADVLVLAVGKQRMALVGLDLGRAPTRQTTANIRRRVADLAGIGALFLVGSHTHHGPVLEVADDKPTKEQSYNRVLENKLVDAIVSANKNCVPAKIAAGAIDLNLNRNRQSKLPDKPVDRQLGVLRVDDRQGKTIAVVVHFAAHPVITPGEILAYSPDYPGWLKKWVEKEMGGVCVFLQGAAGDMSPNRGDLPDAPSFGETVGQHAVRLARQLEPKILPNPQLRFVDEELHFKDLRVNPAQPAVKLLYATAFFPELAAYYAAECKDGIRPRLTVAVLNDQLGWVGGSGEFFSAHALRLRERARLPNVFFLGYCNDHYLYFPTIEAAAEGGYGADPGVSIAPLGAGEAIINRALIHLYELRGKFKKGIL